MLDPRAEYLRALNQALLQESEPEVANATRSEIEAHLDAAIQARMELGDPYQEAVAQSIAVLGPPKSFAAGIGAVHSPGVERAERRMLKAAWGLAAVVVSFLLTLPFNFGFLLTNDGYLALYTSAALGLLALVLAFSFVSRRFAVRRLAMIGAVAGLGVWITLSTMWLDLGPEGGLGVMTRGEAARSLRAYADRNSELERNLARLDATIRDRTAKGDGVSDLYRQREEDRKKLDHNQYQSGLIAAAANRSIFERAIATFANAVLTGTATALGLLYFNGMGVLIGRYWRRFRIGGKARA